MSSALLKSGVPLSHRIDHRDFPLPFLQKEVQQQLQHYIGTNKYGRFVYSHRLSSLSEMTWQTRTGYMSIGLGLQKRELRKTFVIAVG